MRVAGTFAAPILDIEGTLARFGGDRQLFVEMTGFLLEDAPQLLSRAQKALRTGNAEAVEGSSHALKGLLLNSGGVRAAQAAQALEDAGHSRDLGNGEALLHSLELELDELTRAIRAYK